MNRDNQEYAEIEGILKRVRPTEPSSELKARVLQTAKEARRDGSACVPWRIPVQRLAASAVAAAILISLANSYADRVSIRKPIAGPVAERAEPCDLDVMTPPNSLRIRDAVITVRSVRPDALTLVNYLEKVRDTLGEVERDEKSGGPDRDERRSRLPQIPSSLNS